MPNRILRDWTDSLAFVDLSPKAERFFVRLIMKADDFGRFHGDERLLKAALFPLLSDVRTAEVRQWRDECNTAELTALYQDERGRQFIQINNFGQRTRSRESKFPSPDGHMTVTCQTDDSDMRADDSNSRTIVSNSRTNDRNMRSSDSNCPPYTETDTETDTLVGTQKPKKNKARGTIDELKQFCVEQGLPETDGEYLFDHWEGNGWKNGNSPIKDWKATVRAWKRAGHLPKTQQATQQTMDGRLAAYGLDS